MSPLSSSTPAPENACLKGPMSDDQKLLAALDRHEVPLHLCPPNGKGPLGIIKVLIFRLLCICAYGQSSLDMIWASIKLAEEGDNAIWLEGRKRINEQQNNILVLAGLLLATTSVFITTPPPASRFLNYTRGGPYLCICASFGLLVGGIVVTGISILVRNTLTLSKHKALFRNRLHVYLTLLVVSYPPLCTSFATLFFAFGVLAGVWSAGDLGFQLGCAVILILPVFMAICFAIASHRAEADPEESRGGVQVV